MASPPSTSNEVFVDAGFVIALVNDRDELHDAAVALSAQIKALELRLVTSAATLLEIGNSLAKARFRAAAVNVIIAMQSDPQLEIVAVTSAYWERAFQLYRDRRDKEWGPTDCFSFVIMSERGMRQALSGDRHFEQAGFEILLNRSE